MINQCRSHFAQLKMNFINLLTVNFHSESQVIFQITAIENANGGFIIMMPLSRSFTIIIKDPFFVTNHNSIEKMDRLISAETALNAL